MQKGVREEKERSGKRLQGREKRLPKKAHHKFSLSLLQPLRCYGCGRQDRQEAGSQMLTSATLLPKSP